MDDESSGNRVFIQCRPDAACSLLRLRPPRAGGGGSSGRGRHRAAGTQHTGALAFQQTHASNNIHILFHPTSDDPNLIRHKMEH